MNREINQEINNDIDQEIGIQGPGNGEVQYKSSFDTFFYLIDPIFSGIFFRKREKCRA